MEPEIINNQRPSVIVVLGEERTGKTCFADMFFWGGHFNSYDPTMEHTKDFSVDGEPISITINDINNTILRGDDPALDYDYFQGVFKDCSGVVLLFDITSRKSFDHITQNGYLRVIMSRPKFTEDGETGIRYPAGQKRFGCILVGNKADLKDQREVSRDLAEWWAESQNIKYIELDTSKQWPINDAMAELVRSIRRAQKWDQEELDEEMEQKDKKARAADPSTSNKQGKMPADSEDTLKDTSS